MPQRTDKEWAAIFRLMQKSDALVSINDDWYDAEIEKVGRKRVTLKQSYDTGGEGQWSPPTFDRFETFEYADLNTVTFWVAS